MKTGELRSLFQVYGNTEAAGALRSVKTTWAPSGQAWGGFVPSFLTLRSYGAGEANEGTREVEFRDPSVITDRDALKVIAGPEAGSQWRVVSLDHSMPGRVLARVEPLTGVLA